MESFASAGFSLIHRNPCFLSAGMAEVVASYELPDGRFVRAEAGADLRSLPSIGSLPTLRWRYGAYAEAITTGSDYGAFASNLAAKATALVRGAVLVPIIDLQIIRSNASFAVVIFEGTDVVDLNEKGFERVEGGIKVPHQIFRVLHAGPEPMVPKKSEEPLSYWTTIARYLTTNKAKGTTPSNFPPFDVARKHERALQLGEINYADTASDVILVDDPESIKYVSYVGIIKPIFRDLVLMDGGNMQEGVAVAGAYWGAGGNSARGAINRRALTINPAKVLRFVWDYYLDGDDRVYNWRLAESFNADPASKTPLPEGLSPDPQGLAEHWVYDLNDYAYPETEGLYPANILKQGYFQGHAEAKVNPSSRHYDSTFRYWAAPQVNVVESVAGTKEAQVILPNNVDFYAEGQPYLLTGSGGLCARQIYQSQSNHAYSYTSPLFTTPLNEGTRVAPEYFASWNGDVPRNMPESALFMKTYRVSGLAAFVDPNLRTFSVMGLISRGHPYVTERVIDDIFLDKNAAVSLQRSVNDDFLLGEEPERNAGGSVMLPVQARKTAQFSSGKINGVMNTSFPEYAPINEVEFELEEDRLITQLYLRHSDNMGPNATLRLYADFQNDPVMELAFGTPSKQGSRYVVSVPPFRYTRVEFGGYIDQIEGWFETRKGEELIGPMGSIPAEHVSSEPWARESLLQISAVEPLAFPVDNSGLSAANDASGGYVLLATEAGLGRIDLALRSTFYGTTAPIRDVVLRVPDEQDGERVRPTATVPFLVNDFSIGCTYLYYLYKGKLFVKGIPREAFSLAVAEAEKHQWKPESESRMSHFLHGCIGNLVYDSKGGFESDYRSTLASDLTVKAVRIPSPEDVLKCSELHTGLMVDYCAWTDQQGLHFVIIDNGRFLQLLRSQDATLTWHPCTGQDFKFIPSTEAEESVSAEAGARLSRPSVMIDNSARVHCLFFFMDGALLVSRIPQEVLALPPEQLEASLSQITPMFIYGPRSPGIEERGIPSGRPEREEGMEEEEEAESAPSQRVAPTISPDGYYRVFFKDSKGALRSLISLDLGETWYTDREFANSRQRLEDERSSSAI